MRTTCGHWRIRWQSFVWLRNMRTQMPLDNSRKRVHIARLGLARAFACQKEGSGQGDGEWCSKRQSCFSLQSARLRVLCSFAPTSNFRQPPCPVALLAWWFSSVPGPLFGPWLILHSVGPIIAQSQGFNFSSQEGFGYNPLERGYLSETKPAVSPNQSGPTSHIADSTYPPVHQHGT